MRKKIVAGNWKMNKNFQEAEKLISELTKNIQTEGKVEVIIAPSFTNLQSAVSLTATSDITIAAQNMHFADKGAFTGEISADMLKSIAVNTVILGHSERRAYFNETPELLKQKVTQAINNQMTTIFCVGEQLEDRKAERHFKIVKDQIENSLFDLPIEAYKNITIAYEPVWAIGTGETATPEQAQEMHQFIRNVIAHKYGQDVAQRIRILYGGSVKPGNALEIFSKPDVDGGLIGGASLKAMDFKAIVEAGKS